MTLSKIKSIYNEIGYNEESEEIYKYYKESMNKFISEYEI